MWLVLLQVVQLFTYQGTLHCGEDLANIAVRLVQWPVVPYRSTIYHTDSSSIVDTMCVYWSVFTSICRRSHYGLLKS